MYYNLSIKANDFIISKNLDGFWTIFNP